MSTAIALRRIGIAVDLVEIEPQWRVAGAGITLTGPTLRAFDDLGVYDEVASRGYVGEGIRVCNVAGEFVRDLATPMPAGAGVAGSGGITRPVLHNILSTRTITVGTRIRTGVSVAALAQDAIGVGVAFSDGSTGRYDCVIGADGVNSHIRELIFADPPRPEYTGQSVWRTFVPRPQDIDRRHYFLGGPAKVGFTPVSDQEMYLFAVEQTPRVFREPHELLDGLAAVLEGYGGIVQQFRESLTPRSKIVFRPQEVFVLPTPWHRGRVLLVGDAAHPTTPQLASGAGLAAEDALVLADELDATGLIPEAFAAFEKRREHRCRMVADSSSEIGRLERAGAPPAAQTAVVERVLAQLMEPI